MLPTCAVGLVHLIAAGPVAAVDATSDCIVTGRERYRHTVPYELVCVSGVFGCVERSSYAYSVLRQSQA